MYSSVLWSGTGEFNFQLKSCLQTLSSLMNKQLTALMMAGIYCLECWKSLNRSKQFFFFASNKLSNKMNHLIKIMNVTKTFINSKKNLNFKKDVFFGRLFRLFKFPQKIFFESCFDFLQYSLNFSYFFMTGFLWCAQNMQRWTKKI